MIRPLYSLARLFFTVTCTPFFRFKVSNRSALPKTGGVIIAPCHRSYIDTPLTCVAMPRTLRFVGKTSIVENKLVARWYKLLGAIAVNPDKIDRQGITNCIELLEKGEALVIFPEGTRKAGPEVTEIYSGVAFIALKAKCPVIPVGIAGADKALGRGDKFPTPERVVMHLGDPIDASTYQSARSRENVEKLTEDLRNAMTNALGTAYELLSEK